MGSYYLVGRPINVYPNKLQPAYVEISRSIRTLIACFDEVFMWTVNHCNPHCNHILELLHLCAFMRSVYALERFPCKEALHGREALFPFGW